MATTDAINLNQLKQSVINIKKYVDDNNHTHDNKNILDAITSDKISSWDSKSTFSGSYNDLADKPTIPTKTSQLTNDSGYLTEHQSLVGLATETYVNGKVSDLVNSSPEALNTLKELADALGNDPNFATTVSNQIGNKVDKVNGKGLSTNDLTNELKANYDAAYAHSQSAHFDGDYNSLSNIPTDLVKTSDADSKYAPIDSPNFINAISMGRKADTTIGTNSIALGNESQAIGNYSHAEGNKTTALGEYSTSKGYSENLATDIIENLSVETSNDDILAGKNTAFFNLSKGKGSSSEGYSTLALGDYSHAEGYNTVAIGKGSHAEGGASSTATFAHAEGIGTIASGKHSHAEGNKTIAKGTESHAEGIGTIANLRQHVQGKFNIEDTSNTYAHIVGNGASDTARRNAHTLDWSGNAWYAGQVEGTNLPYNISSRVLATIPANTINLDNEITATNISLNNDRRYYIEFLGIKKLCSLSLDEYDENVIICSINNYKIKVYNYSANIIISISKINNDITTTDTFTDLIIYEEENKYLDSKYLEYDLILQNSISLGRVGNIGPGSSAIGVDVEASGYYSHAEGNRSKALYLFSHAEGNLTTASGESSHAEGNNTKASGESSHAEGSGTTASGNFSHVEGKNNTASAFSSHAEGNGTKASAFCSHAEGYSTTAEGQYSHAEGSDTTVSGSYSHAEGYNSKALGDCSHVEGCGTTASGNYSHVEGYYTIAKGQNQHVQGKYNIEDTANKYAHIVGNGASYTARSNAHTLDWEGNAWYAGKLSQEGTPTADKDLTTKKYVDDRVAGLVNSAPAALDTLKELSTALGDDPNFATTMTTALGNKVDKVDGKTLSTNDLTNELKANYDAAYAYSQATHSYNDLTDKPVIPSIEGLATEDYVNRNKVSKTSELTNDSGFITREALLDIVNYIDEDINDSTPRITYKDCYAYTFNKVDLSSIIGTLRIDIQAQGMSEPAITYSNFVYDESMEAYYAYLNQDGNIDEYDRVYITTNNSNTIIVYSTEVNYAGAWTHVRAYAQGEKYASVDYVNNSISSIVVPTKTSDLTNDSGFITSIPSEYITEEELTAKNYIDNTTLESKGYLTEHQDLSGYALRSDLHTHNNKAILDAITDAKITEWNSKSTFSGSYNDLTNKPTIPTITNDLTNALKANYDAAYTHSQSAHAPSNAQKNSDITKAEIEAKLTGNVTTHTHSQYLTEHQDISGLALKSELHTHTNKSILDSITSDKISSWDNKSTFSGSYNDLTDKPTIPSVEGFATESYVDSKFLSEEIIFEGRSNDPLVLHDYYTHVPIADGMGFWVINKTIEINSSNNPYVIEISGSQGKDGVYGPNVSTFNSTYNMWVYDLGNGDKLQMGNIEYNGSPALAVAWDTAGSYSNLKITKRIDLMNTINSKVDKTYVDGKVSELVNSSPATLDTLKELADALGNDPNFATTVSNQIGNKVDKVSGKGLSTNDLTSTLKANYDAAYTHSQAAHAPSDAQKNSDITKAEIEAKLTGNITTHTHSQYLTSIPSEYITEQELTSKGYITEAVLTSKGYITEDVLTSKGYATESQINSAVEAAATTDEEVKTTVNQILGGVYIE